MTEQNIRDAFENSDRHKRLIMSKCANGDYVSSFTAAAYSTFKAGYIAAFKVILESENE